MTRIIAGSAGGRRIEVPSGQLTRPTTDRVREALFSALESRGVVVGARVLDLFAGSGAVGLEAASRGAAEVVLVDSSREAMRVARRNVTVVGAARVSAVMSSVDRYLSGNPPARFDLVFADPPYSLTEADLTRHLAALAGGGWLSDRALVVVERSTRTREPRWPEGLTRTAVRRYGESALWQAEPGDG